MNIAALIIAWNGAQDLRRCLQALLDQSRPPETILAVDNASADETPEVLRDAAAISVERGVALETMRNARNLGFTAGANVGLKRLLGGPCDTVFLVNQDAQPRPACLAAVARAFAEDCALGALGCKILYPDGVTLQHAGGYLDRPRQAAAHYGHHEADRGQHDRAREVEFVTGAAMALRAEALRQVGVFDEVFAPGYYEDVDLCLRLRRSGWAVRYDPQAVVTHVESASFTDPLSRGALSERNRILFALPDLADPRARDAFARAEVACMEGEANFGSLRILGLGYARALLALRGAARARLPADAPPGAASEVIDMLRRLRQHCLSLMGSRASRAP
jgi:GT2 family glycosyltransferase